jgi:anti-sigma regulatory factor (Ser/Thr protein kinase)
MSSTWLEVRLGAGLAAVRVVNDLLDVALRAAFVDELTRHDTTLCVAELVTNVVEHERPALGGEAEVSIRLDIDDAELRVTVTSPGAGYDVERHIAEARERTTLEESTEGGMGLLILASLFDVTSARLPTGHQILLRRAL